MPIMTRGGLRWSKQISFSNAVCKVNYTELEHCLKITRRYAINVDIEGEFPGSMCHYPGLAQRNLPPQYENDIRGLSRHVVM